jgi:hypothetical protein
VEPSERFGVGVDVSGDGTRVVFGNSSFGTAYVYREHGGEWVQEFALSPSDLRQRFRRGDTNGDGLVDVSDAVAALAALFTGEGAILCADAADANDDGTVDITDPLVILSYNFVGDAGIPVPGPSACGEDPTADEIGCAAYQADCVDG